jgi:N-acetylglucosamine malate deacetylase 1
MKQPYRRFIDRLIAAEEDAKTVSPRDLDCPARPKAPPGAATAVLLSPHPDDECIVGGLALRLLRESGMRVVNVAVTLGGKPERKAARWAELIKACRVLGFEAVRPCADGYDEITRDGRNNDPNRWNAAVRGIVALLASLRPAVLFFPHAEDWHPAHVGVHDLAVDALRALGKDGACVCAETEFWRPMNDPNLLCEVAPGELADLMGALSAHEGETARNPYHLRLPAWMQDNVRRGGEVVGGQGGEPPAYRFATLYRATRWTGSDFVPLWDRGRLVGANEDPASALQRA